MRRIALRPVLVLAFALAWAGPLAAQDRQETLADIRQQLSVLWLDVRQLRDELNTTGAPDRIGGATAVDRLQAIEAELQRLTSKTEELEFRVNRITRDGTNRIGDLEFRLCELEEGCDVSQLGDTPVLGGVDAAEPLPQQPAAPPEEGPALAVGEREDFERAEAALEAGEFEEAAQLFAKHAQDYPGGPLSARADYLRGEALEAAGATSEAARAYLDAFSGAPGSETAPDALFKLGTTLAALGQMNDACVTLSEVPARFPDSPAAADAQAARAELACP